MPKMNLFCKKNKLQKFSKC